MNLKDKIMIERLSRLEELQPAEQEEVLRDPVLQQALVENRLLGGLAADAPPPPNLEPTLEMALSRPKSREDKTMSVRTTFAGVNTNRFAMAGIAAALVAVIAVTAIYWVNTQNNAYQQAGVTNPAGSSKVAKHYVVQHHAEEQAPGVFLAQCRLPGVKATSAEGRDVTVTLGFEVTSSLSDRDAADYRKAMAEYDKQYAEYERKLADYNRTGARAPAGLILAGHQIAGTGGGGRTVAAPAPPRKPGVPTTVLARALNDEAEAVAAAVAELITVTPADRIDTPEFCAQVKDKVGAMFDAGLGTIEQVKVESIRIS